MITLGGTPTGQGGKPIYFTAMPMEWKAVMEALLLGQVKLALSDVVRDHATAMAEVGVRPRTCCGESIV